MVSKYVRDKTDTVVMYSGEGADELCQGTRNGAILWTKRFLSLMVDIFCVYQRISLRVVSIDREKVENFAEVK